MRKNEITSLDNLKKIHFIGIGGSGMFPLAYVLHLQGFKITGSDTYESDTLKKVKDLKIPVFSAHSKNNISDQDLVVFSAAIKEENPEIQEAMKKGIPIIERSYLLGIIFKKYSNSIGVSGTHGKTTTTAMISSILIDAKLDPTCIIGGTLPKIKSNSCAGKSDIIVAEACEYVDSFLHLTPKISVITNVDEDHLDYFKTFENVKNSFKKYARQTRELLVVNGDNLPARECVQDTKVNKIFFGLENKNNFYASNISFSKNQCAQFDIMSENKKISSISLKVPGMHNVYNALAAFCTCLSLGINTETIKSSLENFSGVHRRFEIITSKNGITVADDFAHHPTEIKTTLESASKMGYKKVWAIFQPHTYSRTSILLDDFAKSLSIAQKVIVSDILPVREKNTYNIHATDLTAKIPQSVHIPTFEEICDYVVKHAEAGDLIITLGGGNVYKCANMIAEKI